MNRRGSSAASRAVTADVELGLRVVGRTSLEMRPSCPENYTGAIPVASSDSGVRSVFFPVQPHLGRGRHCTPPQAAAPLLCSSSRPKTFGRRQGRLLLS